MIEHSRLSDDEHEDEDSFFARGDRALIDKARRTCDDERQTYVREVARMRCPDCGVHLVGVAPHGVAIEHCPRGHGMWLTEVEMRTLANRERHSWIGRYFYGR